MFLVSQYLLKVRMLMIKIINDNTRASAHTLLGKMATKRQINYLTQASLVCVSVFDRPCSVIFEICMACERWVGPESHLSN